VQKYYPSQIVQDTNTNFQFMVGSVAVQPSFDASYLAQVLLMLRAVSRMPAPPLQLCLHLPC
jgi:hypothetical protein